MWRGERYNAWKKPVCEEKYRKSNLLYKDFVATNKKRLKLKKMLPNIIENKAFL